MYVIQVCLSTVNIMLVSLILSGFVMIRTFTEGSLQFTYQVQFSDVRTFSTVLKNLIEEPKAEGGNFMYHFMYEPCRHAWTHPFIVLYMDPTRVDIKNG